MNKTDGLKIANHYDIYDETTNYWTDGKKVYFKNYEIKNADINSFVHFHGGWAVDKKNCYIVNSKLRNADRDSFVVLNTTYAKDKDNVWTLGGKIKDVDAASFEVCDDGKNYMQPVISIWQGKTYTEFTPYGYGKDKNNVYHYDYSGKPNIVKGASPDTFYSLNNGHYGYDDKNVFWNIYKLNKANPKSWRIIKNGYFYSKDKYVYYTNRVIKEADVETFEVIENKHKSQYAKDKNHYYDTDLITKNIEKFEI
jgi:hypothetical protein